MSPPPPPPPPPGASPAMFSVGTAIGLGLLASFVQSLGLTIQRKSHLNVSSQPIESRPSEWRQPLWLLGFFIFIVANIGGTIFQIGALPIVMLAPLGAVSLLYNALLAKFLLQDALGSAMIAGTALILAGAVLIGLFGAVQEPPHNLDELMGLFGRPPFIALATMMALGVASVLVLAHMGEYIRLRASSSSPSKGGKKGKKRHSSRLSRSWSEPNLAPLDEVSETQSGVATPVIAIRDQERRQLGTDPLIQPPRRNYGAINRRQSPKRKLSTPKMQQTDEKALQRTRLLLAVAFAGTSGTLSGVCLLLAKSGVELLVLTFGMGQNQFTRVGSWMLVVVMILAALAQLWYLNKALKMADPTFVCPLAFCFYNTSSIALGLVYFDQVASISALSLCLVVVGIVILLAGVFIVSMKPAAVEDAGESLSPEQAAAMSQSSPIESEGLLTANAAGIAGPHLPPPVTSSAADESALTTSPELAVVHAESPPVSPKSKSTTQLQGRRRSSSDNGNFLAGLGLHLPTYHVSPFAAEEPSRSTHSGRRSSIHGNAFEPTTGELGRGGLPSFMVRGLSIGISPSSPGFHIGPFSPTRDGSEEHQRGIIRELRRKGSKRTFSEADVDHRRAEEGRSGLGQGAEPSTEDAQVAAAGTVEVTATESTSNSTTNDSAFAVNAPPMDGGALSRRLGALRKPNLFGGVKGWWRKNVQGQQDAAERRRLLEE